MTERRLTEYDYGFSAVTEQELKSNPDIDRLRHFFKTLKAAGDGKDVIKWPAGQRIGTCDEMLAILDKHFGYTNEIENPKGPPLRSIMEDKSS